MIAERLEIRNFKSVKNLEIDCRRINVFIGEPNTGKSNILEALGFVSSFFYQSHDSWGGFVRYERPSNLFYDEIIEDDVEIILEPYHVNLKYQGSNLSGTLKQSGATLQASLAGDYGDIRSSSKPSGMEDFPIKYYKFKTQRDFSLNMPAFLLPASGKNLVSLILTNKRIKGFVEELLRPFGLRLVIKPQEMKFEIIKLLEDIIITYPYALLSDTLHRTIFHMAAIMSNKNSVLVFEEPESHAFPYYTKYLAEKIALDQSKNQYFIATHNPYLLLPILEKTPQRDIGVYLTYYEDYQTKVKTLKDEEKESLLRMDVDVFFKLEELLGKS